VFLIFPAASLLILVDHPGDSSQLGTLEPKFQQLLHIEPNSIFIDSVTNKHERKYTRDCGFSQYTRSRLHVDMFRSPCLLALSIVSYNRISYLESNQISKNLNLQNLDLSSNTTERVEAHMLKNNTLIEQTQFIRLQHFLTQSCCKLSRHQS
jgi:hypothetical protein